MRNRGQFLLPASSSLAACGYLRSGRLPWMQVNKDTSCSVDFTDEAVEDFDFLFAGAVVLLDGFVNDDFFDQGV